MRSPSRLDSIALADDVPVPCPYGAQKIAAGPIRDLIELAPEHGDTGLRVDARGADVLVSEKLVDVGDIHAEREQPCRHGVAQQVGIEVTSLEVVHAPTPHPIQRREFTNPDELCNRARAAIYARVSTVDQSCERQITELTAFADPASDDDN